MLDSSLEVYHALEHDTAQVRTIIDFLEASEPATKEVFYLPYLHLVRKRAIAGIKATAPGPVHTAYLQHLGIAYRGIGFRQRGDGMQDSARANYHRSVALYRQLGDSVYMANGLNNIGTTYYDEGAIDSAIAYMERSAAINQRIDSKIELARCYSNLGVLYRTLGNIPKAVLMEPNTSGTSTSMLLFTTWRKPIASPLRPSGARL